MRNKILIGIGIVILLLFWSAISIYPDWLWFGKLNFAPVFWTMLLSRFGFGFVIWALLVLFTVINLYAARRMNPPQRSGMTIGGDGGAVPQFGLSGKALDTILIAVVIIASFVIASKGSLHWDKVLRFLYQVPFNSPDPILGKDIGFYVFSLPFHLLVRYGLMVFLVFAGLITLAWYLKDGVVQIIEEFSQSEEKPLSVPKIKVAPNAMKHLVFLLGLLVVLLAWGYQLKIYGLLYSTQGPAFGASYTDVHVKVWAYRLLILATLAFAAVLIFNAFRTKTKLLWLGGAVWLGLVLLLGTGLPVIVQKLVVKPTELRRESPYIKYNIEHTRRAYNLNKIQEVDFAVKDTLSAEDIHEEDVTIQNIRIWDERPLLQTYRQIQAIRLYYDFTNVDVDRYIIDGQFRQVMLAARELDVNQLPPKARTWVNRHLIYTHGYGIALSPVNEVTKEGLPQLFIKDLPPAFETDLSLAQPEIYFGEKTDDYILVKTKTQEFDYPKGDKNVYTTYQGKGGVHFGSFKRRLLFAIEFMDPQILFTNYLSPESRIMYNRKIDKRARLIAPFLSYDADPYLVVSEGRLYWMLDAYTTSDMYPYSLRTKGHLRNKVINYIRNSVKVTIDAYNGEVNYYKIDDEDPIVKTYTKIFPKLFKPFESMPEGLKKHIRYPKDLFKIQAATYTSYHMTGAQVFYNQEDLWQLPDEIYGESRQQMDPYYIIIKLPESTEAEYLLMLPFTPSKKDNMIGWLAARSDQSNYGNLLVYKLPKEKLVYGPMQIEARVDQQTEISRELSLWGQRGSRVIRGNLLAIPLSGSFLYVEPIYLQAKQERDEEQPAQGVGQPGKTKSLRRTQTPEPTKPTGTGAAALPELKRVIVALGNQVIMEENLDRALRGIVGEKAALEIKSGVAPAPSAGGRDVYMLGRSALAHYQKAKEFLKQGDWAAYGRELKSLERVLGEMSALSRE